MFQTSTLSLIQSTPFTPDYAGSATDVRIALQVPGLSREDLGGIVAKWKDGRYNPERQSSWLKIKKPAYIQNMGRQDLFQKRNPVGNLGSGQESKIGLIAPTF
jgi:hypothetical protein